MSAPYRVLLADPPWKFGDKLPGPKRGATKHYRTLTVEQIAAIDLPPLAEDCVLFLWRVASMQAEALAVIDAWGFTLKTEIVWKKLTRRGARHFGMGHIVRAEHETCLVAIRGRPVVRSHSVRSLFEARVGRHSEKPTEFYEIVESLYAGPYLELFARRPREGWSSLGDELGPQSPPPSGASTPIQLRPPGLATVATLAMDTDQEAPAGRDRVGLVGDSRAAGMGVTLRDGRHVEVAEVVLRSRELGVVRPVVVRAERDGGRAGGQSRPIVIDLGCEADAAVPGVALGPRAQCEQPPDDER